MELVSSPHLSYLAPCLDFWKVLYAFFAFPHSFEQNIYRDNNPNSIIPDQRDDPSPVIGHCRPSLNRKKEGKEGVKMKLQPTLLYPLKAPGILQVRAKTNNCGLKSPLVKPGVITATASPDITKTRE